MFHSIFALCNQALQWFLSSFFPTFYARPTISPGSSPRILLLDAAPIRLTLPPGSTWPQSGTLSALPFKFFNWLEQFSEIITINDSKAATLLQGAAILLIAQTVFRCIRHWMSSSGPAQKDNEVTFVGTPISPKKWANFTFFGSWTKGRLPFLRRRASPVQVWNVTFREVVDSIGKRVDMSVWDVDTPTKIPNRVKKRKASGRRSGLPRYLRRIGDPFDVGFDLVGEPSFEDSYDEEASTLRGIKLSSTIFAAARCAQARRPKVKLSARAATIPTAHTVEEAPVSMGQTEIPEKASIKESIALPVPGQTPGELNLEIEKNVHSKYPAGSEEHNNSHLHGKESANPIVADAEEAPPASSSENLTEFGAQEACLQALIGEGYKEARTAAVARSSRPLPLPGPPPSGPLPPLPSEIQIERPALPPPPACPLPPIPTAPPHTTASGKMVTSSKCIHPPRRQATKQDPYLAHFHQLHPDGSVAQFVGFLNTYDTWLATVKSADGHIAKIMVTSKTNGLFQEHFKQKCTRWNQDLYNVALRGFVRELNKEAFNNLFAILFYTNPKVTEGDVVDFLHKQGGLQVMLRHKRNMVLKFFEQAQTGDLLGLLKRWSTYLESHPPQSPAVKKQGRPNFSRPTASTTARVAIKKTPSPQKPAASRSATRPKAPASKQGTEQQKNAAIPLRAPRTLQNRDLNSPFDMERRRTHLVSPRGEKLARAKENITIVVTKATPPKKPEARRLKASSKHLKPWY